MGAVALQSIQIRLNNADLKWLDAKVYELGGSRGSVIRALIRAQQDKQTPPLPATNCKSH